MSTSYIRQIMQVSAMALILSTTVSVSMFVSADAAYAERGGNGNGNGNGRDRDRSSQNNSERGNSGRSSNGNGRGALASELKGLNAAHANQNAMMNASPNSMPGKLYAYQQAVIESAGAVAELEAAQDEYDRLIGLTEEQIETQFPDGGYEAAVTQAAIDLEDAQTIAETADGTANVALLEASGGRELSDAAMDELKRLLGL